MAASRTVPALLALSAVVGVALPLLVQGGWGLGLGLAATVLPVVLLSARFFEYMPEASALCSSGLLVGLLCVAGPVVVRHDVLAVVGREVECSVLDVDRYESGRARSTQYQTTVECPDGSIATYDGAPRGPDADDRLVTMLAEPTGVVEPQRPPSPELRSLGGWWWTVPALGWLGLVAVRARIERRRVAEDWPP